MQARRSDTDSAVTRLAVPAVLRVKLDRPEVRLSPSVRPALRVLRPTGWELVPAIYDPQSKSLSASLTELPVTVAVVDDAAPAGSGDWDPKDPAAVQFSDGAWGVAAIDGATPPNLLYRRALGTQEPVYWLDALTIDSASDSPALVRLSSTIALFYRKASGSVKQVWLRTSTDDGASWSSATQLTTESVNVYQIQASVTGGTVYVFWSLSDTSGTLQYRTSTDLSSWAAKATVGQAVGPLQNNTSPQFDLKKYSSGTWGLTWLNSTPDCTKPGCTSVDKSVVNNTSYPVVGTPPPATSPPLRGRTRTT